MQHYFIASVSVTTEDKKAFKYSLNFNNLLLKVLHFTYFLYT